VLVVVVDLASVLVVAVPPVVPEVGEPLCGVLEVVAPAAGDAPDGLDPGGMVPVPGLVFVGAGVATVVVVLGSVGAELFARTERGRNGGGLPSPNTHASTLPGGGW
jgi:hypothetical protein